MAREDLTKYDIRPEGFDNYIKYNGPHFNEKLLYFAISKMYKRKDGELKQIEPYSEEDVERILNKYLIRLENQDILLDHVYVANMAKADYAGSSIEDDKHLALYIKNVIDDVDAYDGKVFTHWYVDMTKKGIPIDWRKMI